MTAFSTISKGEQSSRFNRKEGRSRPHTFQTRGFWGVEGFMPATPGEWTYSQQGLINSPTFRVAESASEIVASLDGNDLLETFGRDSHAEAKAWMDDQIFELMQHDADIDDPSLDWQPAGEEIDIDEFMTDGRWVRS